MQRLPSAESHHMDEALAALLPGLYADRETAQAMLRFSLVAHDSLLLACDTIAGLCEAGQAAGMEPPARLTSRLMALHAVMTHADARLTERIANALHGAAQAVADAEAC